jgi:hypothetical protein
MPKFPRLIHVVEEGEGSDKFLAVYTDGIVGVEDPTTPVAIYKLVEVGRVDIKKTFRVTRKG